MMSLLHARFACDDLIYTCMEKGECTGYFVSSKLTEFLCMSINKSILAQINLVVDNYVSILIRKLYHQNMPDNVQYIL